MVQHDRHQGQLENFETLAHELRTPLTSIRGSLALVLSNSKTPLPEASKSLIKMAYRNTLRMIKITDNLLDAPEPEKKAIPLRLSPYSLNRLLEQTIQDCLYFQKRYGIIYHFQAMPGNDLALMDRNKIRVVVENLLFNAAKYTQKGDVIEVKLQKNVNGFQISVTDHGPGIPKAFQEKIFKRYARAKTSQEKGLGIGLSICKKIIELHGGHLDFRSSEKGTTFFFELKG